MAVTAADVRNLNDDWEHLDNGDIQPFIDDAGLLLTKVLPATTTYTAAHQDTLQKWLAAHFLSMKNDEYRLLKDVVDDMEQEIPPAFGPGLRSSKWGQQLLIFDTEGHLDTQGVLKAQFRVIVDDPA